MEAFLALAYSYGIRIVIAIAILIVGLWIVKRIRNFAARQMEKRQWELGVRNVLAGLVGWTLRIALLISVAGMFGVNVLAFVGVFSAMALAIGLALQGHLANFASGVLILIFKFFRVGDFVQVNGESGTVKDIHIFHTVLEAVDNRLITVPNGQITSNPIHNYTVQGRRKHDLVVGISYSADIPKAKELIIEVIKGLPDIDHEAGYDVFVKGLADSSVNIAVRFMAANEFFWPAYKVFFERIKISFDEHGIGIPFPQMDVHLHQEERV